MMALRMPCRMRKPHGLLTALFLRSFHSLDLQERKVLAHSLRKANRTIAT
jgi:hypothetical protein